MHQPIGVWLWLQICLVLKRVCLIKALSNLEFYFNFTFICGKLEVKYSLNIIKCCKSKRKSYFLIASFWK
jgi:hypothetical protein